MQPCQRQQVRSCPCLPGVSGNSIGDRDTRNAVADLRSPARCRWLEAERTSLTRQRAAAGAATRPDAIISLDCAAVFLPSVRAHCGWLDSETVVLRQPPCSEKREAKISLHCAAVFVPSVR